MNDLIEIMQTKLSVWNGQKENTRQSYSIGRYYAEYK